MDDRYLWDRGGDPDAEILRLEGTLRRFRGPRNPFELPARGRRRFPQILLAAAAISLAAIGLAWAGRAVLFPRWRVEAVEGAPLLDSRPIPASSELRVGRLIETDGASRAAVAAGAFARIAVAPGSRLRLLRSGPLQQRFALDRGAISAKISAPPRLFVVETPSALAVDLGCEYTLTVDPSGAGLLRVQTGWVSFEREGRESIVPAGASCATRAGQGPGTPFYEDATIQLRSTLERFDFEGGGDAALSQVLASARKRDALTLWHLLQRVDGSARERVYDRFAALVPPPPEVTRDGVLSEDPAMLEKWRWELEGMPLLSKGGGLRSLWRRFWFGVTESSR
jgi:hypothetical protein